jgi:hypothetical protein
MDPQSCVLAVVLYKFASFAGTQSHVVSISFSTPFPGQVSPTRAVHVPLLTQGVRDTQIPHIRESLNLHIVADTKTAAAAAAAAAASTADAAALEQQRGAASAMWHGGQQHGYKQQPARTDVAESHAHTGTSSPLPWRALHHLGTDYGEVLVNASSGQAPAYLVSAFLDTRPTMHGQRAVIAVILAIDKRIPSPRWKCLLQLQWPSASNLTSDLAITYSLGNNEAFFNYKTSTGFCECPQLLQGIFMPSSSLLASKMLQHLSLTIVETVENGDLDAALLHKPHIWVPVEQVPPLTLQEQQRYLSGKGSIAVCTPPVHTDAYAATLVGWQAFHKQMGVQQVIMYSFNPGPLIKPLMDFYADQGFAQVHEWIIPVSILESKQQPCLLPFFHASKARATYDSPPCTYHQVG